jgi:hypothetical protein
MTSFRLARMLALLVAALTALVLASLGAPSSTRANTPVSGSQTGTWTLANSPYLVTGSVFVPNGGTLTIEPGVVVRVVPGSHRIDVHNGGTLIAEGTAAQPIIFTSDAASPAAGDWDYLWLQPTATASLRHCSIQYAGRGNQPAIYIDGSNVALRSCQIGNVAQDGVQVRGGAQPHLTGNWFRAPIGRFAVSTTTPNTPVRALNNYWNHPTGPSHRTLNPFGLGVPVGDGVLFDPWLASEVNTPPTITLLGPAAGATFSDLPVSFTMTVSDVDVRQYQYFRVELFTEAGAPVATFDQQLGGSGWSGPFFRAPATATLRLPLGLPNGVYRWRATVDDGFGPVTAGESRTFSVTIVGPAVAGAVPDVVLGEAGQRLSVLGVNLTPATQVLLRQTIGAATTELAPTALTVVSTNELSATFNLATRSGLWEVVVREGGVERRTTIAVAPALPVISVQYVQGSVVTPGRTWTHQLIVENVGTAAGVAVVALLPPPGTEPVLNVAGAWEGRLGSPDGKSQVLALPLNPGQRKTVALPWRLPFDQVLAPNAPRELGKVRVGDGLAFFHVVLASPPTALWQQVQAEARANDLEDLVAGAVGASHVVFAAAYETLLRLPTGDETSDPLGDYLAAVARLNPTVADALMGRWLGTLHEKLLEATGERADSAPLPLEVLGLRQPVDPQGRRAANEASGDSLVSWAAGEVAGFWNTYVASPETAVMLLAEAEGFVDGVTFGLVKPDLGAEYLKCALGVDPWYQSAGQISGNVLSLPVDSAGLVGKGIARAGSAVGQGMRKLSGAWTTRYQGTTKTWFNRFAPTYNSPVEPYRIGIDWVDDVGNSKNLVHWGVTPRGEAHVAIGWTGGPLRDRATGELLRDAAGRPIVGANFHLYNNRVYFPQLRTAFGGRFANWTEFSLGPAQTFFKGAANAYKYGNVAQNIYEWWTPPPGDDCSKKPTLRASWDPNDITGFPGPPFLHPSQPLDLLIRFENLPQANLAAEDVVITMTVDANVDLASLRLGPSSHPSKLIPALNAASRVLTLTFQTINLPPNKTPPEGEGSVWLSLTPLPTLPSGAKLSFQATIVFDENPPIITNRLEYTIDVTAPTSTVASASDAGSRIAVAVQANDNAGGSGVQVVEVVYSQDGATWFSGGVVRAETPSGSLPGVVLVPNVGGRVLVLTIAHDALGNVEDLTGKQPTEITLPARTYLPLGAVRAGP